MLLRLNDTNIKRTWAKWQAASGAIFIELLNSWAHWFLPNYRKTTRTLLI